MRKILFGLALMLGAPLAAQPAEEAEYVGSARCVACHEDSAQAWEGSHHALAWTEATPDRMLADFDDTEFQIGDMLARFSREGDDYIVTVTELDGVTTRHKVHSLGGVAPLQQMLIETEPGRIQSFDVVWDVEGAQWYHLYPDQNLPPQDALHWTGPYKNWNARCAECHATGYSRNYDARADLYRPEVAEIGVGCEACHGPGSTHLALVESGAEMPEDYGFSAPMADRDALLDQCLSCHSRREPLQDGNPLPGTAFHDAYNLALLREGAYHADGQILDEVYVAGSFLQSKMYASGVGCLDCHDAHTAQVIADDNSLCTQCHSPVGNDAFPTLRLAEYDDPSHHFHPPGVGAECKSCHMIERPYMGIDWRRDHSFRVPRPDLAAEIGGPDACTDCHTDQTPDWAAAEIAARFPDSTHRGPHFGQVIAAGRADPRAAAERLRLLALDTEEPGIARATALYLLENAALTPDEVRRLDATLRDPDPLVRAQAALLQRARAPRERAGAVVPLLSDPMRNVRMSAARSLIELPPDTIRGPAVTRLTEAFREWQGSLQSRLDFPETHLTLAGLALLTRNFDAAAAGFAQTTKLDPQRADAWIMQIRIAAALGQWAQAQSLLDTAQGWLPDDPVLQQLRRDMGL